eukprot:537311-Prorocentrum_minimum.AAC.2
MFEYASPLRVLQRRHPMRRIRSTAREPRWPPCQPSDQPLRRARHPADRRIEPFDVRNIRTVGGRTELSGGGAA